MANSGRTNFVRVDNLAVGYTNGYELCDHFSQAGTLQDITLVGPTTAILSYQQRSAAENAVFALDGQLLGNQILSVSLYHNTKDPQFFSNPLYQGLGQYIGQDHHRYDPSTFRAWGSSQPSGLLHQPLGNPSQPLGNPSQPPGPTTQLAGPPTQPPSSGLPHVQLPQWRYLPPFISHGGQGQGSTTWLNYQGLLGGCSQVLGAVRGSPSGASTPATPQIPTTDGQSGGAINQHTLPWQHKEGLDNQCSICICPMEKDEDCRSLRLCGHSYHSQCLEAMLQASPSPFLQCPTCKKVHGVRTGNRPLTGNMSHRLTSSSLPGHQSCGTIEITFSFSPGIQGPEHPVPGRPYRPVGFPRVAYLPDNKEGERALHGLYLAWEQRLLFTVGTSLTTQMPDCVTWNDIHLKTKIGSTEHGYPDPHYLANLSQELAGFGITEAEIGNHMAAHPGLRINQGPQHRS